MKGKYYSSVTVRCPFYKKETRERVVCGGFYPDTSIHHVFGNYAESKVYKDTFCRERYQKCPIYSFLAIKENSETESE